MIIHWIPVYDNRPISWTQPEPDKLIVEYRGRSVAIDFSDPAIVEYDLEAPVNDFVGKAWREHGVLHLEMPCYGLLSEIKVKDHGEERILSWR